MATYEWMKENKLFIGLSLMRSTDSDIVEWVESQENRQGAIKKAIRYYLSNQKSLDDVKEQ